MEFFGVPMIEMEGFYHSVELTFAAEAATVSVSVPALSFETELVVPQNANPLNLVLFGDTRTNHDKHEMVVERIALEKPDVVVHTGDMVSGGGNLELWDLFFGIEGEMLAHTMFAPAMGNHELSGEGFFDLFFEARWHREGKKRTYVQDYGLVGLVVLDNYSSGWKSPEDVEWLDATLEELSDKRWLIVALPRTSLHLLQPRSVACWERIPASADGETRGGHRGVRAQPLLRALHRRRNPIRGNRGWRSASLLGESGGSPGGGTLPVREWNHRPSLCSGGGNRREADGHRHHC